MSPTRRHLMAGAASAVAAGLAPTAAGADEHDLASVRWEYRPLLLFTPSEHDPRLSRQTTLLGADERGLADRRLAILIVEPGRIFTTFGAPVPEATAKALRRRFRVPDDAFRVVLVGLDGGTKLTVDDPLTLERLYSTIDAMPMRQRELRGDGNAPR